jgi:hypothetical protein
MSKKRSWVPIVLAILGVVIFLAILAVGGTAYYFVQHVGIDTVSAESAEREFETARRPFAKQEPLLLLDGHDVKVNPAEKARHNRSGARIEHIHVLAFDPDEDKLVRLSIPWWLVRMKGSGRVRLNSGSSMFDSERVSLDIEDLERHGPGLILDAADRNGQRVLIWAQ